MKSSLGTLAAVVAVSLLAWAAFYVTSPGAPLTADETLIVVAAAAGLVLAGRWILSRLRRQRGGGGDA